jgi:hypothetical protein
MNTQTKPLKKQSNYGTEYQWRSHSLIIWSSVISANQGHCRTRCSYSPYPTTRKAIYCNKNTTFLKENKHFGIAATCLPQPGTCSSIPANLNKSDYFTNKFGYKFEIFAKLQTHILVARPDYCSANFRNQFLNLKTLLENPCSVCWWLFICRNWKFSATRNTIQ